MIKQFISTIERQYYTNEDNRKYENLIENKNGKRDQIVFKNEEAVDNNVEIHQKNEQYQLEELYTDRYTMGKHEIEDELWYAYKPERNSKREEFRVQNKSQGTKRQPA